MSTAKIDNIEVTVEKGTTILQAALQYGIHIPHYCYHPALKIDGNCRMCLVEVEKMPKLTIACNTEIKDGMVISTSSPKVVKTRRGIIEFFLINHPLDCPVCDKAGECILQDYSYTYGAGKSRFKEDKIVTPKKDIGEHILLYSNRCILCSRCVRFCRDISGTSELGIINRGGSCEIDISPGRRLDNMLSGNVVDICPVGALTSKEFLFKCRVWFLTRYESICPRCSAGCNINVEVNNNKVYRVTPRHNPDVNGYWICNNGRYNWDEITGENRLTSPLRREGEKYNDTEWDDSIGIIKERFLNIARENGEYVGALLSPSTTNEENFLLCRLMRSVFNTPNITLPSRHIEGNDEHFPSGFVIEADKTPNYRGATTMLKGGGISFEEMKDKIRTGKIKCLYVLNSADGGDGFSSEEIELLKKVEFLVVHDTFKSNLTSIADIVLPGTLSLEKEGTFTNSRGIVQRLRRVLSPSSKVKDGWEIIQMVSVACSGKGFSYSSSKDIFDDISKTISGYKGLSYERIGRQGVKINE